MTMMTMRLAALALLAPVASVEAFSLSMTATQAIKKTSPADALKGIASKLPVGPAKKGPTLNPIAFGSKVIESEDGKEAAALLIDGGLNIVGAVLDEGKSSKVLVPTGFDRNGKLKTRVVNGVGLKELADVGLFAAGEALGVGKRLYIGKGDYARARFKLTLPNKKPQGVTSPVSFALKVAQSEGGKEAAGKLIDGGLKLVKVIVEEGGKYKVSVPTGYVDYKTGEPTFKELGVGPKELIDLGLFAGSEALGIYNKIYFGDPKTQRSAKLNFVPERRDTKGRFVKAAAVEYYVNVGGKRIKVSTAQNKGLL